MAALERELIKEAEAKDISIPHTDLEQNRINFDARRGIWTVRMGKSDFPEVNSVTVYGLPCSSFYSFREKAWILRAISNNNDICSLVMNTYGDYEIRYHTRRIR